MRSACAVARLDHVVAGLAEVLVDAAAARRACRCRRRPRGRRSPPPCQLVVAGAARDADRGAAPSRASKRSLPSPRSTARLDPRGHTTGSAQAAGARAAVVDQAGAGAADDVEHRRALHQTSSASVASPMIVMMPVSASRSTVAPAATAGSRASPATSHKATKRIAHGPTLPDRPGECKRPVAALARRAVGGPRGVKTSPGPLPAE